MPTVMPSQVVKIVDRCFPAVAKKERLGPLDFNNRFELRAIIDLLEKVPDVLISAPHDDYAELILATSLIREHLAHWARNPEARYLASTTVVTIRNVMARCPDEFPAPAAIELSFIDDNELRDGIRSDVGATYRSVEHAEWKAATVLAGATIEALLHWILTRDFAFDVAAAAAAELLKVPESLDGWVLGQFIPVARRLEVIREDSATAAMLAKDYRNLIHPGRTARTGQRCDRGTAYSAIGALERVVADVGAYCGR